MFKPIHIVFFAAAFVMGGLFGAEPSDRSIIAPVKVVIPKSAQKTQNGGKSADTSHLEKFSEAQLLKRTSPFDILGYWLIPDSDNNNAPESVVFFYRNEKDNKVYCKMIAIFDEKTSKITDTIVKPVERAKGIKGSPYLCGMDFIFGLTKGDDSFQGHVIDPDSGSIYRCEVWFDVDKKRLVVRGELLIFGENQYWFAFDKQHLPFNFNTDNILPYTPFNRKG